MRRTPDGSSEEVDELLANALRSNSLKSYANQRQAQCVYRLFDNCTTPNCNLRCPSYINLFGGGGALSPSDRSYESTGTGANSGLSDVDIAALEQSIDDPAVLEEVIRRQR